MTATVIEHTFTSRGAAREVFSCRDPEVLIAGAAGTGKSRACLEKIHMMMLLNPGAKALLLRKTHTSLTATGLATFRDYVIPEALAAGFVRWYGGSSEKPPAYVYSNGSEINVGGMDNPTKIMSSEYDVIYVQEATELSRDDWEKCTSRLRNGKISFQQIIADCNPDHPTHWLKRRCDDGLTTMLYGQHMDNPRLFDDAGQPTEQGRQYLARLDALTGVRRLRLLGGIWAAAEGLIYEDWNPAVHLIDRRRMPLDWERYWVIDFGYTNPFVWQQWAVDPDGRLYLEREVYHTQRIVADHARQIIRVVTNLHEFDALEKKLKKSPPEDETITAALARQLRWIFPRPQKIICDHDAEDRATLERELGMSTSSAKKGVSDGIQAMQKRLRVQEDGRARIYVFRDSLVELDRSLVEAGKPTKFADEITGYVWMKPPRATTTQEKPEPDQPLKLNDHSMDTARYISAELDNKGRANVRWL